MNKDDGINVLLNFDDNDGDYARHAAVTILSLLETNKKNKIKIYIMSSNISSDNIKELTRIVDVYEQKIEFIIDNNIVPAELKKVIINKNNLTWGAWYRLFFPKFIKGIDRILYIDCDVLVMKDISEIYNMDMCGKAIAGWYDCYPFRYKGKIFGTDNYINSGVLLFDAQKYDMNKITVDAMVNINVQYSKWFHGSDQDKINLIFKDDIFIYNESMNYQITSRYFNQNLGDAVFVHCLQKPYVKYSSIPKKIVNLYYHYLDMTKWKGYPIKNVEYGWFRNLLNNIRNFCFHFLIWMGLGKYISKFFIK